MLVHKNSQGKYLAVTRRFSRTDWGFPGGKVDPGETPQQAIMREMKEETGLEPMGLHLHSVHPHFGWDVFVFTCSSLSGTLIAEKATLAGWKDLALVCNGSFSAFNTNLASVMRLT
jgi:8-oxo-dGTP diphosphatase